MKTKLLLATMALLGLATTAHAGWELTPYLGYESGSYNTTNLATPAVNTTATMSEIPLGLRFGYRFGNFSFELDGSAIASGKNSYSTPATTVDDNTTRTMAAVNFGYNINRFKTWLIYAPVDQWAVTSTAAGSTTTTFKGYGYGIGFGFMVHPRVSIDLNYVAHNYTDYSATVSGKVKDIYSTFTVGTYALLVSFPFMLGK